MQKTFTYTQLNIHSVEKVFPLLCPVREKDWLDGWDSKMIHSKSGLIEQGCIFTTAHHGEYETVWYVAIYDMEKHFIEFIRVTPQVNFVKITVLCKEVGVEQTEVQISYQYTGLNPEQNNYIETSLEQDFKSSMIWWEKAINYYLTHGKMLKK